MMIKNIIFDIGNVLAGFAWEEFYRRFGYSDEVFDRLAAATVRNRLWYEIDQGSMTTEEIIQGFKDFDPSVAQEIEEVFHNLKGMIAKYDYAYEWVKSLQKRGCKVYIISNIAEKVHIECKAEMTFLDIVDGATLSYQEKVQKPDSRIYKIFLEKYGLSAQECIFIDDQERNIQAAAEQGIRGIVFGSYPQAKLELETCLAAL